MKRSKSHSRYHIERDFRDAFERLRDGRPQNPDLRNILKSGKSLQINISNVAKEAGRSRQLIATDDCRYPEIRQLVLIEKGTVSSVPRNSEDVIISLRSQVAALRAELAEARELMSEHLYMRQIAEKKLASVLLENERAEERIWQLNSELRSGDPKPVKLAYAKREENGS